MATSDNCSRCAGPDGAHQPWCLLQQVIERFLTPPRMVTAPAERTMLTVGEATALAREAAREAVAEAAAHWLTLDQQAAMDVALDAGREAEVKPVKVEPVVVEPVVVQPTGEAEAMAEYATEASAREPEPQKRTRVSPATQEKEAAADLFVAEYVYFHDRTAVLPAPAVMAAYEAWRPHIDAPAISAIQLGAAMRRAGHTDRRQAAARDGYPASGPRPMLYFGLALREVPATTPPVEATPPPPPVLADRRAQREDAAPAYEGAWPGREIPADFRNKIVVPILRSGKGWEYRKGNANGRGKPRLISPEGRTFTLPNTPSDWRALKNSTSELRKLGAAI